MATEKFRTLAETTLGSSYSFGGSFITVLDVAPFPPDGDFRVRLDNTDRTVLKVTSVVGATFNTVVEKNDGTASAGASVVLVDTAGASQRMVQSPEPGEARGPSGVDGADFYGPIHKLTALDQSGWTWDNQSTKTVVQAGGIVFLSGPATGAGTSVAVRYTAAPTAPYVITAAIQPLQAGDDGATSSPALMFGGIGWRSVSGTLRLVVAAADGGIYLYQYVDSVTFDLLIIARLPGYSGGPVWLQIEDDTTDHFVRYSLDGRNFTLVRQSVVAEFTPTDVGFALSTEGALASFPIDGPFGVGGVSVLSWIET